MKSAHKKFLETIERNANDDFIYPRFIEHFNGNICLFKLTRIHGVCVILLKLFSFRLCSFHCFCMMFYIKLYNCLFCCLTCKTLNILHSSKNRLRKIIIKTYHQTRCDMRRIEKKKRKKTTFEIQLLKMTILSLSW